MVVIVDSGTTKSDWLFVDELGKNTFRVQTAGINPKLLSDIEIRKIFEVSGLKSNPLVKEIKFYGAGCSERSAKIKIKKLLQAKFKLATITVDDDLMMASLCLNKKTGVICIMGTGSNSCFFDGSEIIRKLPSLGYLLMDDGSGNYFGRALLRSYIYSKLSPALRLKFEKEFDVDEESILKALYKSENTSAYLATFAQFLIKNKEDSYLEKIIERGISTMFSNLLTPYDNELKKHSLCFIGSIAYYLEDYLYAEAKRRGYIISSVIRRPIEFLEQSLMYKTNLNER